MKRPDRIPRMEGILLGRTAEEQAVERGIAWERRDAWRECMGKFSSVVTGPIDAGVQAAMDRELSWLDIITWKVQGTVRRTPQPPPMLRPSDEAE